MGWMVSGLSICMHGNSIINRFLTTIDINYNTPPSPFSWCTMYMNVIYCSASRSYEDYLDLHHIIYYWQFILKSASVHHLTCKEIPLDGHWELAVSAFEELKERLTIYLQPLLTPLLIKRNHSLLQTVTTRLGDVRICQTQYYAHTVCRILATLPSVTYPGSRPHC